jgi:hypothetical protein
MQEHAITSTFKRAAQVMRFRFEPSYVVMTREGTKIESLGLVPNFGAENGTLIFSESEPPSSEQIKLLEALGYYCSQLYSSYATCDEALIRETLNDWQFLGATSDRPSWYKGSPWGQE